MRIIICKPLESGETNVKMQCTKEERRALEDLEGQEIDVPLIKGAQQSPNAFLIVTIKKIFEDGLSRLETLRSPE